MPGFGAVCRGDADRMESSGDRSACSGTLGSHLIDIVEAGYIDICTVTGNGFVKGPLSPQGFN